MDPYLRERVAGSVARSGGNIIAAVHPVFFTADSAGAGGQLSFNWEKEVLDPKSDYNLFRDRLISYSSRNDLPLFIFHDRTKPPSSYYWLLEKAAGGVAVVVYTMPASSMPLLSPESPAYGERIWNVFCEELKELGVKKASVLGEYLFYSEPVFSGCVKTAWKALNDGGIGSELLENLTYPYGVGAECSTR